MVFLELEMCNSVMDIATPYAKFLTNINGIKWSGTRFCNGH